jgi:hypothetical protein
MSRQSAHNGEVEHHALPALYAIETSFVSGTQLLEAGWTPGFSASGTIR